MSAWELAALILWAALCWHGGRWMARTLALLIIVSLLKNLPKGADK